MDKTTEQLEEDEERFHKNLLTEQNNFQDRLDGINMVVAGFSAHTDINKYAKTFYLFLFFFHFPKFLKLISVAYAFT